MNITVIPIPEFYRYQRSPTTQSLLRLSKACGNIIVLRLFESIPSSPYDSKFKASNGRTNRAVDKDDIQWIMERHDGLHGT